jgi:hypothetical protein
VTDPSYRIQVAQNGIYIYNRSGFDTATDPYALYPQLGVENDGGHAFYLGAELARAQIAWELGKRYVQDQKLAWGDIVPTEEQGNTAYESAGPTLSKNRRSRSRK